MFRLEGNPANRRGEEAPDNKTSHAQESLLAGEEARPWSEESCGRREHSRCVRKYWIARPATRRRTHSAAARPRRTSAREVLRPAARVRKNQHVSLWDRTGRVDCRFP